MSFELWATHHFHMVRRSGTGRPEHSQTLPALQLPSEQQSPSLVAGQTPTLTKGTVGTGTLAQPTLGGPRNALGTDLLDHLDNTSASSRKG